MNVVSMIFAEAELFDEIIRSAEQRRRRHLAVDQQLHAAEQQAVLERQLDAVGLEILLEPLNGGVVAARLIADRNRHAGEIGRRLHQRIPAARKCRTAKRNSIGVELAVAVRGRDIHRPMAGTADIAGASGLECLVGADLVAELVAAAGTRIHASRGTRSRDPPRRNSLSPRRPIPAAGSAERRRISTWWFPTCLFLREWHR